MTLVDRLRPLPGGGHAAQVLVRLADARKTSMVSTTVRRLGGFPPRPIPAYWWTAEPNFGDMLSAVIVRHMSGGDPVRVSKSYTGKVLAVGSIIHRAASGDCVWGSGAISGEAITPPKDVKFHAVRGPLTRNAVRADLPEVYGDPVMLMPRIYAARPVKTFAVGIVPHLSDIEGLEIDDPAILKIDVRHHWRTVVDEILSCDLILSSSLHGLIVAEAYGIPAAWITIMGNVNGGDFKFHDYYLSTLRDPPAPIPWRNALRGDSRSLSHPPTFGTRALIDAWPQELTFGESEG